MRDAQGTLSSFAGNLCRRRKEFSFGGAKQGRFFTIPGTGKVAVCEGYATAASIHMATGWTTVVAFDAGNLLPAAQAWREAHPGDALVICGDDDRWKDKNAGREAAEECARAMNTVACFLRSSILRANLPTGTISLRRWRGGSEASASVRRARYPALPISARH